MCGFCGLYVVVGCCHVCRPCCFFKQKTAYELRISDWSSDVCSSDQDAHVDRIVGRYTCAVCGEGYHERYKQPKVDGTCDVCGNHEFKRRPDDNAETVRTRMAEYRAKTAPILPIYDARGLVRRVDGKIGRAHV